MVELILGGLFALICGSYAFTWRCFEKLEKNHLRHLEDRVEALEKCSKS